MSLLKNSSLYLLATIINGVSAFVLLPVYSRYLTTAEFGIVSAMETLATILGIFAIASTDRASQRFYFEASGESERVRALSTFFWGAIITSLVLCLLAMAGHGVINLFFASIPFYPFFLLAIGFVFFDSVAKVPLMYFQTSGQAGLFLAITALKAVLLFIFVYYLVVGEGSGAAGQLLAKLISAAGIFFLMLAFLGKKVSFQFDMNRYKEGLAYSWPFIPTLLFAWVLNLSDRIFIERFHGLEQLGLYSMAYKVSYLFTMLSSAIQMSFSPYFLQKMAAGNRQSLDDIARRICWLVGLFILAAFAMTLFTRDMVHLFLSDAYKDIAPLINILVLSHTLSVIMGVTSNLYYLHYKKTRPQLYIFIISGVANIVLNLLLIQAYGIAGAAVATVLSLLVLFIMHYGYARSFARIPVYMGRFSVIILILALVSTYLAHLEYVFSWAVIAGKIALLLAALFLLVYGREAIFRLFGTTHDEA